MQHTLISMFLFCFYRVLKPPGGGTSDIFGGAVPNTPRSQKNRMASNIFAAPSDIKNGNGRFPKWIGILYSLSPLYIHVASISIYIYEWIDIDFMRVKENQTSEEKKNQFCFQNIHFSPFYFHFQSSSSRSTRILSILFHRYTLSLSIHEYWKTKKQKIAKSNSTHDNNHQFTLFAVTQ